MTSEILFKLPDESYENYSWVLQDEHGPSSVPPLLDNMRSRRAGFPGVPRMLRINGFAYARVERRGQDAMGNPFGSRSPSRLEEVSGWRDVWIAESEKLAEWLEAFDPASVRPGTWRQVIGDQHSAYQNVFFGVHGTAVGPVRAAADEFSDRFITRFGEERREDLHALFQGFANGSLDRAGTLWDLGRILAASPELLDALDHGQVLPDTAAAREFGAGFTVMIERFGSTTNADMHDMPVWREDPAIPMAAIRAYAHQPADADPRLAAERQRQHRLQLEARLRREAEGDAELASMLDLMVLAQHLLPNLEDHNLLCDQRLAAASRARWLAIGRHLVLMEVLDSADDVFYLTEPELLAALEGQGAPPKSEIADRSRQLKRARAASPPPVLGRPLPDEAPSASAGLNATESRVLRGIASAPGSYRGRARIIETIEEAGKLEQGDILVCRTTSPPWTPFFNLISALVTNTGGSLSHGAIVAREFGIPAVTGTTTATAAIREGATITVDGTTGLVIIED